jgi:NADH-quinone oxidoreductase subunit G
MPHDPLDQLLNGRRPLLLMDIHEESKVNQPEVHLDELPGPATFNTFNGEPMSTGHNVTDIKEG